MAFYFRPCAALACGPSCGAHSMPTKQPYRNGKRPPPQPGDEAIGDWSRERLFRMDARFRVRMERAIAAGLERPQELNLLRPLEALK
jgi:hypothetical protein